MEEGEDFFDDAPISDRQSPRFNITLPADGEEPVVAEPQVKNQVLLDPDHPLLEKFQRTLKEYLLKQLNQLSNDVFELETDIKKTSIEREKLGVETYEVQQIVSTQRNEIDYCVYELAVVSGSRALLEDELATNHAQIKAKKEKLCNAEMKEIELRKEVDSMNLLVHQMGQWENDTESELMVNQRVAEKTKKDKIILAEEKRSQDMVVYKLMSEVWRLEGQMEIILMQLRVKEDERNKLSESVTLSNIDIQANETEYRCLLNGWQSIIVAISNRDKHYNSIMSDYANLNIKVTEINCEISQTKRLCGNEMMKNESLTLFKTRIEQDIKLTQKQLDVETDKYNSFHQQAMCNQALLEQQEKDIARVKDASHKKQFESNDIIREFEKCCLERRLLEEDIIINLEDQVTNNKAAHNLNKQLRDVTAKNRNLELTLANLENSHAKTLKNIEDQRYENNELHKQLEDINIRLNSIEAEVDHFIKCTKQCSLDIKKKTREIEIFNKRIGKFTDVVQVSPTELRVDECQRQIDVTQAKNKELQTYWVREQQIVVDLAVERQEQLKQINLLKKQNMILDQKNLKILDEMNSYKREEEAMNRSIIDLRNKLMMFTDHLNKKKTNKDILQGGNSYAQIEFADKLQEAELETLKLEAEIAEIDEDKLNISNILIERNRDCLCWDKKIQMATETRKNMIEERGESGDVGKMKLEIHRMEVRYSQLKKAQDKMSHDLEHCVFRREAIVVIAEGRQKKVKKGSQNIRVNVNKKMDDLKNQIQKSENECENVKKRLEMKQNEIDAIKNEIEKTLKMTKALFREHEVCDDDINFLKTQKQFNLDILLSKQRKIKIYSELSRGRLPFTLYKTEAKTHKAYKKEKELNSKLQDIVEHLTLDFPHHHHLLSRISNTLQIPTLHL